MRTNNNFGFTLIEMLMTMAILAIILGVTAPSMGSFLRTAKSGSDAENLYSAIRIAKSQALALGREVAVCPLNDSTSSCGTSTDWGLNGIKVVDVSGTLAVAIKVWPPANGNYSGTLSSYRGIVAEPDGTLLFDNGTGYSKGMQYLIYCAKGSTTGSTGTSVYANGSGFATIALANIATAGAFKSCP